jgi:nicotinamide N-methyltransferase/phenylethanolamine N-methyltransferase/methyltransferase
MSTFVTENNLLHTSNYKDRFDTESYLKGIYSGVDIDPNEAPFSAFFIENTVRVLKNEQKRLGSTKALEFGGGPSIWPSFLLAQYVDSIKFCDYAPCNLNAVQDWIEQKNNAFDWTNFFEKILDANKTPREKLPQWESRLRDALTRGGLSACDVNDSKCPILNGKEDEYDIIFSSLCLEAACLTIEIFNETIKRLVRLLKPGGLLLLHTVRNESFYYVK